MSNENSIYWLAKAGTVPHEHCEKAIAAAQEQVDTWRAAFAKLAEKIGFTKDRPFYFAVNRAGFDPDLTPQTVSNVAIFLPSGGFRTTTESNRELRAIGDLFAKHGIESKVTRSREMDNGSPHLKLILRKKADKQWFSEIVGDLPGQQEPRKVLGRILKKSHPDLKADTWFQQPGTRRLNSGDWLIQTGAEGGFGDGWITYLTAAGFDRLKAWEGLKLIEDDKAAEKAVAQ